MIAAFQIDNFFFSDAVFPLLLPLCLSSIVAVICYIFWRYRPANVILKKWQLIGLVAWSLTASWFTVGLVVDMWGIAGTHLVTSRLAGNLFMVSGMLIPLFIPLWIISYFAITLRSGCTHPE